MRRYDLVAGLDRKTTGPAEARAQRRRTKWHKIAASALICVSFIPGVTSAAEESTKPPSALLGKSVLASWLETRIQRRAGVSDFHPVQGTIKLTIYIGADGHVFNRYGNITSGQTFQNDQVAPFGAVDGKPSAARHIMVTFRNGFAQCSVSSTWAKENGASTSITLEPIHHTQVETQSISSSAESCAVQNGNVFGAH